MIGIDDHYVLVYEHEGGRRGLNGLRDRFDRPFRRSPPRRYRSDEYKRWFPKTARVFLRYLKRSRALPVPERPDGDAVGVVVCPWVSTAAPWYSIMLAIGLARRGRKVVLLWDDTGFPERDVADQNRAIGRVLSYVGQYFPVVRLSDETSRPPRETDAQAIEELTDQNLAWRLRGAPPAERHRSLVRDIRASLESSLPFVRSAVDRADLDCLVVPGGVYGSSGLFLLAAAEHECRVATFDADLNVGQVCVGGIAAQSADVPRAFDALWNSGEQTRQEVIAVARAEFQRRNETSDRYGFQAVPARAVTSEVDNGVLIPLNVEWDTAALGKRVHFESTSEWLTSTITAILEMDGGPVTVRQHPSERRERQRSKLDILSLIHI